MKLFFLLVTLPIILLILVRYIERHSLYFPMKVVDATPALIGLPYEEIYFNTSDKKRLNAWFVPNNKAKFTVIFCHGNAGNIGHRLEKILIFHKLGLGMFIFDYRGYGKSEGVPSEQGFYKDLYAAYDYLAKERRIPKENIVLYGESIGGAVVIDFAQKIKPAALITEEAFTSVKDMIRVALPFIPHFLLASRFDSVSKIKDVTCPKLIIHSVNDEIIPFSLGEKLFEEALPPKEFLKIRGSHNTAFLDSKEQFTQGLKSFLDVL